MAGGQFGDLIAKIRWETENQQAIDDAQREVRQLGDELDDTTQKAERLSEGVEGIGEAGQAGASRAETAISGIASAIAAVAAAANVLGDVYDELDERGRRTATRANEIGEIARQTGQPLDIAQAIYVTAQAAGVDPFDITQIGNIVGQEVLESPDVGLGEVFHRTTGTTPADFLGQSPLGNLNELLALVSQVRPSQRASFLATTPLGDAEIRTVLALLQQPSISQTQEYLAAIGETVTPGQIAAGQAAGFQAAIQGEIVANDEAGAVGAGQGGFLNRFGRALAFSFDPTNYPGLVADVGTGQGLDPARGRAGIGVPGTGNFLEFYERPAPASVNVNVRVSQGEIRVEAEDDRNLDLSPGVPGSRTPAWGN